MPVAAWLKVRADTNLEFYEYLLTGLPPLQLNAMLGTHTQARVLEIPQKQSPGNFREVLLLSGYSVAEAQRLDCQKFATKP